MLLKDLFSRHHALRITLIYLAFAALWILVSDRALEAFFGDVALLTHMQTLKGIVFVVITALMLYLLIARTKLTPRESSPNHLTPWAPLLIFLMLAVAISLTGWYAYTAFKRSLEEDVIIDLTKTGNLKKTQAEAWLHERQADVTFATQGSFLAREALALLAPPDDKLPTRLKNIEGRLKIYQEQYRYSSVSLIDPQGQVRLHAGEKQTPLDSHRPEISRAIREKKPVFLDFHTHLVSGTPKPYIGFIAPVIYEGQTAGALLLHTDPETTLNPTLGQHIAKLQSEESFFVRQEGQQVRILNRQRLSMSPAMSQIHGGEIATLTQSAVSHGSDGIIARYVDDSGRRRLAYAIPVHNTPWVLFTQVDEQEIFAPIRRLALIAALMTATVLILGGSLTWLWWQRERNREAAERAQAALERQLLTQHYDYLSRYANDVIILTDDKGRFIEINDRALELYGYSREEMLGMRMADLRTDTPASFSNTQLENGAAGLIYETEHHRKDGTTFIAEISARIIEESGHEFLHMVVREITDRKRAENALRGSEQRFRHLIEKVPVPLGYTDAKGNITFINERFRRIFGYQPEDIPDMRHWSQLAYPDASYRDKVFSTWVKAVDNARRHQTDIEPQEVQLIRKDGQHRTVVISGITFDRDVLVTMLDITERRASEQRIRQLTQLYATLSRVNETIVQVSSSEEFENLSLSEHGLYQSVCEIATQQGGMVMAWIGTLDPDTGLIQPVASAGRGTEYLDGITISSRADMPEGQGPTGTAMRENHPVFLQDFMQSPLTAQWHERAARYGWQASAAIPVCRNGRPCAVLTLYQDTPGAFDDDAAQLLMEVASDVGLALENLDIRAERKASHEKLEIANLVVENSPSVLWRWSPSEGWRTEYVSSNVSQYGYAAEDFLSGKLKFSDIIHPEDVDRVAAEVRTNTQRGHERYHQEYRILSQDGQTRWISDNTTVVRDADGVVTHYQGVTNDITELRAAQTNLERLGATLEKSLNEIYIFDAATLHFELVNEGARQNLGYSIEELRGMTPMDISPEFTLDQYARTIALLQSGKQSTLMLETVLQRKDGTSYPVEIHLQLMHGEHPVFVALALDISERKAAENALKQSKQHFQAYFETSPIGMAAVDIEKGWLEVNKALCDILGYPEEELKRKPWPELTHPDDIEKDAIQFNRVLAGEVDGYDLDKRFIHKNGGIVSAHISVRCLRKPDGQVDYFVSMVEDLTERMQAQQKIEYLAHFDPLTSLPNRTLLTDRVNNLLQLAARTRSSLATLYLDLDRFKNVNDSLGHAVGDQLLQEVAKRMQLTVRHEDTVSRMGGDEFVILLPDTNAEGAARVAQKLLDALAQPYHLDPYQLNLTASIGIAMHPENGHDFGTLSRAADTALYRAKQAGRNNYQFFTEEQLHQALHTLEIEIALRQALEQHQLVLHYQPQVDAISGQIVGAEALVRWQHPEWGLTPPGEFIPIAEEVGLITAIGEWVMSEAVRQNAAWQRAGLGIVPVAVNLSIAQFRQNNLVDMVSTLLRQHQLDPAYLELELTESIAMENIEFTIETVERLHALGPKLSIDDFGTGYSSLSYLKRFQVDKLKIDQSFVQHLAHDVNDEAIVIAIINMAKSLGFKVIAEGVETVEQLAFLRARQCDEVQGYLFSRPIPADEFAKLLASGVLHPT